MESKSW
jgi:hypothetical protein